jgi:hypothetical protein
MRRDDERIGRPVVVEDEGGLVLGILAIILLTVSMPFLFGL